MTNRTDAYRRCNSNKRRRVSEVVREVEAAMGEDEHAQAEGPLAAEGDARGWAQASTSAGNLVQGNSAGIARKGHRRSRKRQRSSQSTYDMPHLDYGALQHVFAYCQGRSRLVFSEVSKLWRRVALGKMQAHVHDPSELHRAVQAAKDYDTIYLQPGLYKERILCSKPVKLAAATLEQPDDAGPGSSPSRMAKGAALSSNSVTFWQERPPAVLSNCDTMCLRNVTIRVAHSSHEYSSVAYGPASRSITLEDCHVLGSTGLRVPYSFNPLCPLSLTLRGCVIAGVNAGLSGVTVVSGQLTASDTCMHDCTYGIEVGKDGHAALHECDICFTECALMCEGHIALTSCHVWANTATWQGRPVVMEDDLPASHSHSVPPLPSQACPRDDAMGRSGHVSVRAARSSAPGSRRSAPTFTGTAAEAAGICSGVQAECGPSGRGIRHCAQLRLTGCHVEYERLKSASASDRSPDADRSCREIRRLMRQMYGEPDQDYEDWQIVVMSDMDSDGDASDEDVEIDSDSESEDDDDDDDEDSEDDEGVDPLGGAVADEIGHLVGLEEEEGEEDDEDEDEAGEMGEDDEGESDDEEGEEDDDDENDSDDDDGDGDDDDDDDGGDDGDGGVAALGERNGGGDGEAGHPREGAGGHESDTSSPLSSSVDEASGERGGVQPSGAAPALAWRVRRVGARPSSSEEASDGAQTSSGDSDSGGGADNGGDVVEVGAPVVDSLEGSSSEDGDDSSSSDEGVAGGDVGGAASSSGGEGYAESSSDDGDYAMS